jgi:hypothetical protein
MGAVHWVFYRGGVLLFVVGHCVFFLIHEKKPARQQKRGGSKTGCGEGGVEIGGMGMRVTYDWKERQRESCKKLGENLLKGVDDLLLKSVVAFRHTSTTEH